MVDTDNKEKNPNSNPQLQQGNIKNAWQHCAADLLLAGSRTRRAVMSLQHCHHCRDYYPNTVTITR